MQTLRISRFWQTKITHWLDRRIPPAHQHQLNMRSVFILPSAFGWMYLALCLCLFLLGTNYQNNVMLLLCFLLIGLFLLNLHASYWNFARLNLTLSAIPPGYEGDHVQAKLKIHDAQSKSAKFQGLLSIQEYRVGQSISIDSNDSDNIMLPFNLAKRGILQLPRITFSSVYPFGLYNCWTHIDFDRHLTVYPRPLQSDLNLQRLNNEDESDDGSYVAVSGSDDFAGLNPYVVGDSINRIAWKHVAKQQQWVIKSFESQTSMTGWLKLPMVTTNDIEIALSKLAFQINACTRRNITFGLDLGVSKIQPASGEAHRQNCLLALAKYPHRGQ